MFSWLDRSRSSASHHKSNGGQSEAEGSVVSGDSFEAVDAGFCVQPATVPHLTRSAAKFVVEADCANDDEAMMRSLWRGLYDQHARTDALTAVRFRRVAESDGDLFKLCPCGAGVSMAEMFLGDGGADDGFAADEKQEINGAAADEKETTDASKADHALRKDAHDAAMQALKTVVRLQRSRMAHMEAVRRANEAADMSDTAHGAFVATMFPEVFRRMDVLNTQISAQFVRVSDLEAKIRHVEAITTGGSRAAMRERGAYLDILREGVKASEDAIEDLVKVRNAVTVDLDAGVEFRKKADDEQQAKVQKEREALDREVANVQEMMNNGKTLLGGGPVEDPVVADEAGSGSSNSRSNLLDSNTSGSIGSSARVVDNSADNLEPSISNRDVYVFDDEDLLPEDLISAPGTRRPATPAPTVEELNRKYIYK